jgi:hypothetical protein
MTNIHETVPSILNPPQTYPGSGTVVMDPSGHLLALSIVPSATSSEAPPPRIDWAMPLRAAGRDPDSVVAVPKPASFTPHADSVTAWRVSRAGTPETTIVAAALGGRIVQIETYAQGSGLGDLAVRGEQSGITIQDWGWLLILGVLPLFGSMFLAVRNMQKGRGDVRGALVIGISLAVFYIVGHVLSMRVTELGLFQVLEQVTWQAPVGHALLHGLTIALAYLAVEPYLRRLWPSVLVSWARIVAGRVRDPIVGRDILIGCACGAVFQLFTLGAEYLSRQMGLTSDPIEANFMQLLALLGVRDALQLSLFGLAVAAVQAMTFLTVLLVLRFLLRSNLAAAIAGGLLYAALTPDYSKPLSWVIVLALVITMAAGVFVTLRFGFVAALITLWMGSSASALPWTSNLSGWIAPQTAFAWALIGILLAYGFATATGGHSLFKDPLAEPHRLPARRAAP